MNTNFLHMGAIDGNTSAISEMFHDFVQIADEVVQELHSLL